MIDGRLYWGLTECDPDDGVIVVKVDRGYGESVQISSWYVCCLRHRRQSWTIVDRRWWWQSKTRSAKSAFIRGWATLFNCGA